MDHLIASALIVYMDTCKICLECYPDVALHVATEHATLNVFECDWCGRKFSTKQVLENHIVGCHLSIFGPTFACEVCDAGFYAEGSLKYHLRMQHNIVKPAVVYQCDQCPKILKSKTSLEVHQRRHKGEMPFSCPKCPKSFRLVNSLKNHLKTVHDKLPLAISCLCEICGRSFVHPNALNSHMLSHQEPTHECRVCGWKTRYKTYLQSHIESHNQKRVHQCEFCDKKFKSLDYLCKHRLMHDDERPVFTCFLCNKSFFYKKSLTTHIKIHQGQLDYECDHDQCEAAFVNKTRLVRHRFEKHNIKEYKCKLCGLQFGKQIQLRKHNHKKHYNLQK